MTTVTRTVEPDDPTATEPPRGEELAVLSGITRRFGSTVALGGVDLTLRAGEIHALLGANGAGKTTLVRILAGLDRPDEGTVEVCGSQVDTFDPRALRNRGVGLVQQHFTLVPTLSASENLVLARPEGRLLPGRNAAGRRLASLIDRYGLPVRDDVPAGQLSVGEQQRLELLRALDGEARVLLLDEPTAVLTDAEADVLLETCRGLAAEGRALAFITHRLAEVFGGATRVTVLREGTEVITDAPVADNTRADLATAMIGSESTGRFTQRSRPDIAVSGRLNLSGLTIGRLRAADIDVAAGEIVGIAGVDGNGQSELEAAVSGRVAPDAGQVSVDGRPVPTADPRARRTMGLAYIPSDRYRWGLVRAMDLADNLELGRVAFWRKRRRVRRDGAVADIENWDVRTSGPQQLAGSLSGGNAQKLVLARELDGAPRAVLACYPTRGLDPGAADAVSERLSACAADGAAVLWVGAELDELLAVADRIVVLADGETRGPFLPPFDRHAIGLAMTDAHFGDDRTATHPDHDPAVRAGTPT
ncbi:MAG: ABC transporter ATP-binding protein [Acidimicrobiales bacterium]